MRTMLRNKRKIWFSTYQGDEPILTPDGYDTGESKPVFSPPQMLMINVSPATGNAEDTPFGSFMDYDHSLITENKTLPIVEGTRIWFETADPDPDEPQTVPYNYTVVQVATSINTVAYAIKRVDVQQ